MKHVNNIICILMILSSLGLTQQDWVTTYQDADSTYISIHMGDELLHAEEFQSPPHILLTFSTGTYDKGPYSRQLDLSPLYQIEARERFSPQGANTIRVKLLFTRLPDYTVNTSDPDKVVVSFPAENTAIQQVSPLETAIQFKQTGSLNFKQAPLLDILHLLAEQNNLNIIAGEGVVGEVSVTLTDVDLADALDAILKVNGYSWFIQGNIIVVKPTSEDMAGELTTRVYQLDYIDAMYLANALEHVLSPKGKVQIFSPIPQGGLGIMGSGMGGLSGVTPYGGMGGLSSGTSGALTGGLSNSMSSLGGSSVTGGINTGMNTMGGIQQQTMDHLLVTDIYANFEMIEDVINELDRQIPQINIAVKFVETKLTLDERMGIDWSMRAELNAPVKESALTDADLSEILDLGKLTDLKIATLSIPAFKGIIDMLSQDGDTRMIQEPQTTTLNNTPAQIEVGTTFPILVPQESESILGEQLYTFEEEEITITLGVTPRINEDVYISMKLQAAVEALVGMTGPNSDRPIVSSRSITNHVMVRDGETLLIGGLIFDQVIENTTTVPVLGRIPLIKTLFTHKASTTEQRELLLFVTPNIVEMN